MGDMNDYIVRDSSIYQDQQAYDLEHRSDASLKVGVVRDIIEIKGPDIAYIVEVWLGGKWTPVQCTRAATFGGIYNYEEVTYRGFEPDDTDASDGLIDFKQGDHVLIAYLHGDSREGIIINGINHPGRPKLFNLESGVVFQSEFNGLNKSINTKGEYTVTFKGIQTNIDKLSEPANGKEIPAPKYNAAVGYSFTKFDAKGSWTVSDNDAVKIDAETGEQTQSETFQSIFIDKPNGQIVITSGKTVLTINKEAESYTIANKVTTFNSEDEWTLNTKKTTINSTDEVSIESSAIKVKGEVTQEGNMEIKGDIAQTGNSEVTGNFSTTGLTELAGGANPLVYDIVLTIGTGNLGAPVISNHVFLKTVQTKAT